MNVKLDDIKNAKNKTVEVSYEKIFNDINPDEAVKIKLELKDLDSYIQIQGQIDANMELICDVCLKKFYKMLNINVDEIVYKGTLFEGETGEIELKSGDLNLDLQDKDEIDIDEFVYQTLILNVPNKCVCDINCNGGSEIEKYIKKEIPDTRLEVFKNIKIEKDK